MIGVLDYAQWSDQVLRRIQCDGDYRDLAKGYLATQDNPEADKSELLRTYKVSLAAFRRAFRPFVTPSTFILDANGCMINSRLEPERMIHERLCGVSPDREFVPLSEESRRAKPVLAAEFAAAYENYREQLVLPSLNHLRTCDRLIVLLDIPTILNSGHLMANDVHDITRDLLDFCRPGRNFLERLYTLTGIPFVLRRTALEKLANPKITRIAFVASKCDLVHEQDRDNLIVLLKELIGNLPEKHDGVEVEFFCGSAVQSTVSDPQSHTLFGVPEFTEDGQATGEDDSGRLVTVSHVPAHWPDRWGPGDYCFPDFQPMRFPGLKTRPPRQLGLDRIFSYVVGSASTDQ